MTGWFGDTFAALASRNFRTLWTGSLLAFVAFFMSTVVQSVVAFQLTGENTAVGFVVFAQGLSQFVLGPLGGAMADRLSKKTVILACQATITAAFLSLALLEATGQMRVIFLAAGSFAIGAGFSFLGPARTAWVVDLVDAARRGNAIALTQVALNASRIIGPLVAGALLGIDVLGPAGAFFTMTLLYVAAMLSTWVLPDSPPRGGERKGVLTEILGGLNYVYHHRSLGTLVLSYVLTIMFGFAYITVLPGLVENELHRGAGSITLLLAVNAVGGLIASIFVASLADSPKASFIYAGACAAFGVALIGVGLAPSYFLLAVAMFFVGAGSGGFQTLNGAVVLARAEPAFYGRVLALTFLAFAASNLAGLPIGMLADAVGERHTVVAMGAAVCAVFLAFRLIDRAVREARPFPAPGLD